MRITLIMIIFFISGGYIYLIFPRRRRSRPETAELLSGAMFAHRGLHDDDTYENSIEAFEKAIEAGCGIELDVRLSADGCPVISHDGDLSRVFGIKRQVSEMTAVELGKVGVPTLKSVLSLVAGKVPMLVEIKAERDVSLFAAKIRVCEVVAGVLDNYDGVYCVESFHPAVLRWFRRNRPQVMRGQLSAGRLKSDEVGRAAVYLMQKLIPNFMTRPDFVAYGDGKRTLSLRLCKAFGAMCFLWTVTSETRIKDTEKFFDGYIFEGFLPAAVSDRKEGDLRSTERTSI